MKEINADEDLNLTLKTFESQTQCLLSTFSCSL